MMDTRAVLGRFLTWLEAGWRERMTLEDQVFARDAIVSQLGADAPWSEYTRPMPYRPCGIEPVVGEGRFAVVVCEGVDQYGGGELVATWFATVRDARVHHIDAVPGHACSGWREQLIADLGFRRAHDEAESRDVDAALDALRVACGTLPDFPRSGILIADDLVYLPYTWIGCCGYGFVRATQRLVTFSTPHPWPVEVWAHRAGIFDGPRRLRLTAVSDVQGVLRLLSDVVPSMDDARLAFELGRRVMEDDWPWDVPSELVLKRRTMLHHLEVTRGCQFAFVRHR